MAYPRNLLTDDEEIVLDRNPHWIFMMGAFIMMTLALLIFMAISISSYRQYFWVPGIAIVLVAIGSLGRFLRWQTTQFVVTTERIITRRGILSKAGMEIPLDRITNISYHQTLMERILGAGDLVIESAGEGGQEPFRDVADPSEVQNVIYRQSEIYQDRRAGSGPMNDGAGDRNRPQLSMAEQIEKLASLRDRGIISDDEFELQKRSLLERM